MHQQQTQHDAHMMLPLIAFVSGRNLAKCVKLGNDLCIINNASIPYFRTDLSGISAYVAYTTVPSGTFVHVVDANAMSQILPTENVVHWIYLANIAWTLRKWNILFPLLTHNRNKYTRVSVSHLVIKFLVVECCVKVRTHAQHHYATRLVLAFP